MIVAPRKSDRMHSKLPCTQIAVPELAVEVVVELAARLPAEFVVEELKDLEAEPELELELDAFDDAVVERSFASIPAGMTSEAESLEFL